MRLRARFVVFIVLIAATRCWAVPPSSEVDFNHRLIQWFKERQKIAHLQVGTIEEIGEDKVLIDVTHHWPKPNDELIVYSCQPTLSPSMYPEAGVVRVETRTWNQVQARIIIEKDFSIKKGDVARYPPVGVILLDCPDEVRDTPQYRGLVTELVASGFTVMEGGELSDFPYGYIVNLDINGKIETVRIISIFDNHLFYTDSTELE